MRSIFRDINVGIIRRLDFPTMNLLYMGIWFWARLIPAATPLQSIAARVKQFGLQRSPRTWEPTVDIQQLMMESLWLVEVKDTGPLKEAM
mmetsp:Transcript_73698/g.162728  ORF Transcript_73698/g.162728 Transcript_73698/m.162728 type:complete len:90 (+) Transcript_73698:278-547(+)